MANIQVANIGEGSIKNGQRNNGLCKRKLVFRRRLQFRFVGQVRERGEEVPRWGSEAAAICICHVGPGTSMSCVTVRGTPGRSARSPKMSAIRSSDTWQIFGTVRMLPADVGAALDVRPDRVGGLGGMLLVRVSRAIEEEDCNSVLSAVLLLLVDTASTPRADLPSRRTSNLRANQRMG